MSAPSTAAVLAAVADTFRLDVEQVRHPSRQARREGARRVAALLLYEECNLSWQGVAQTLGLAWASGSLIESARRADARDVAKARRALRAAS